jgi:hypothetical protein
MVRQMNIRLLPWIVALVGLAIPLVGSGFVGWELVIVWLVALALIFLSSRQVVATPSQKMGAALMLLPLLLALAWVGGWWLIPANLTWLVIEMRQLIAERAAAASR